MLSRYRKRYRKMRRWIQRATIATASLLGVGLLTLLGFVLLDAHAGTIRNPGPVIALFAASVVVPFLVAGICESVLTRLLHLRFRRAAPRHQRPAQP